MAGFESEHSGQNSGTPRGVAAIFALRSCEGATGFDAEPQRGVSERNRPQGGT